MMRQWKKLLSLIFAFIMVFTVNTTALAAEAQSTDASSTVGTLTIFSANDGGSSSWNTSRHSFIAFKNTSYSSIRVGGLNVGSGHEITIGTWGNKSQHTGIWYNLESYFVNNTGAYSNRVSLSMSVTQSDINTINNIISNNDKWSLTNNCTSFAIKVWNNVSNAILSGGIPNTPTALMSSIKAKSAHQTGRSIRNTTPIGYVSNGSFVSVTASQLNNVSVANETPVMDTVIGNAEFITPIDMNPYSYTAE